MMKRFSNDIKDLSDKNKIIKGLILLCLLVFINQKEILSQTTYYVDNKTGSNSNTGTSPSNAWQSIAHVNSVKFYPGDSILFKCGGVWTQSLRPLYSGTTGSPIVYSSYGTGPKPKIDIAQVTNFGIEINLKNYLVIDNFELTGNCNYGIWIEDADYITVKNCYIHHISVNDQWHGIVLSRAPAYTKILNNEISYCGSEAIYGDSENVEIAYNYIHHINTTQTTGDCIHLNVNAANFHVHNNILDHSNNYGPKGVFVCSHNYYEDLNPNSNGIFEYNICLAGPGDDYAYGSFGQGEIIRYNIFINRYREVENRCIKASGQVYYNTITGFETAFYCRYSPVEIYNNVILNAKWGLDSYSDASPEIKFKNNILCDITNSYYVIGKNIKFEATNNIYEPGGTWKYKGNQYNILSSLQQSSGEEAGSKHTGPLFMDAEGLNYEPAANSPSFDAGAVLDFTMDMDGDPITGTPDIGAHEYIAIDTTPSQNIKPYISNQGFTIFDNISPGTSIGTIKAFDTNSGQKLSYQMVMGNLHNTFQLSSETGELSVNSITDLGKDDLFTLLVKVTDDHTTPLSDMALITVNINHVEGTSGNNRPVIHDQEFDIIEGDDLTGFEMQIEASDPDAGQNLTYMIVSANCTEGTFALNSSTGVLTVLDTSKIDFNDTQYSINVQVQDDGEVALNNSANITVNLYKTGYSAANNPPVINDQEFNINEGEDISSIQMQIEASDPDAGQNLTYMILSANCSEGTFALNSSTGVLTVLDTSKINFDDTAYSINVQVQDDGEVALNSSAAITVNLHKTGYSAANNPPEIDDQEFDINEGEDISSIQMQIEASDPDPGQNLTYTIVSADCSEGTFALNSLTGILTVIDESKINFNDAAYNINIQVHDDGDQLLTDMAVITVNLLKAGYVAVNNPPEIDDQEFDINEGEDVSSIQMQIEASDPDAGQNLIYTIVSADCSEGTFGLNTSTGILTVSDASKINFEDKEYNINVHVKDDAEEPMGSMAVIAVKLLPSISTVYIDPGNAGDPSEDGSIAHPFDSWADVSWKDGYSYMQKKGTTANEGKINVYADNVILGAYGEGERPVINSTANDFAIRVFEKSGVNIQGLKIVAPEAISCIYFLGASSDNNIIENCRLEDADNGIRVIEGKIITLRYNTFTNTDNAIYSYAETTVIYYNIFKGNITGVNISSYLSSTEIYNNVFYGNNEAVSTSYSSLTIYNNIFYLLNNGDVAINHKMDNLVSDNNIFFPEQEGFLNINNNEYATLYEYQMSTGLDMNSFNDDPLFKDIYNDNFNVEAKSPAIDAGKNVGLSMDFYGYSVPYGLSIDIGLIESLEEKESTSTGLFGNEDDGDSPVVYPNPSDGRFKITFMNTDFITSEVQIKDMAGNLIYRDYIDGVDAGPTSLIDVSDAAKGIYVILVSIDEKLYTQRMIIK
jgi:hypothetical protein